MANRKASLIRCAKVPDQGWRRGVLIKTKNGRFKPDYMMYKGQPLYCPKENTRFATTRVPSPCTSQWGATLMSL